jgi:hypothetical protein
VPLEMVPEAVGAVCDAILAVLQNVPANYGLRLEELGVSAANAERVLESIATEITVTMQQTADSHDAAAGADTEEDDSAGDRLSA